MASYPAHRQFLIETCSGDLSIFKGGIRLKVQGFECGNELMNRDFSKTLKQDEFPDITLTLIDLKGENTGVGLSVLMGEVDVEIAGVNHRMQMRCTLESLSDGRKRILGSQPLSFSDFGIVPPRRLLGMVRVENEINVDFTLILREVL